MSGRAVPREWPVAPVYAPEQLEYLAYGRIADEVEGCLAVGLRPNLEMLVAKFPEFEPQVRALFPILLELCEWGRESEGAAPASTREKPAAGVAVASPAHDGNARNASAEAPAEETGEHRSPQRGIPRAGRPQPPPLPPPPSRWSGSLRKLAGPFAAIVVSIFMFIAGVAVSRRAPLDEAPRHMRRITGGPALDPQRNFATGTAASSAPQSAEPDPRPDHVQSTESSQPPPVAEDARGPEAVDHAPAIARRPAEEPAIAIRPADADVLLPLEFTTSPPPQPVFRSAVQREMYFQHMRSVLQVGLQPGRANLEEARLHAAAARDIHAADPRLNYALALVLSKQLQHEEAQTHLRAAAEDGSFPYLPAWRRLISLRVLRKDYAAAGDTAVEFARVLQHPTTEWPDEPTRLAAVQWLGNAIGILGTLTEGTAYRAQLEAAEQRLIAELPADHRAVYQHGHRLAEQQITGASAANEQAWRDRQRQRAAAVQNDLQDIARETQDIRKNQANLEQNISDWNEWLAAETTRFDRTLYELEQDFAAQQGKAAAVTKSIFLLQQEMLEIAELEMRTQASGTFGGRVIIDPRFTQAMTQRSEQLSRYRREHEAIVQRAAVIQQRAVATMNERKNAVDRYQNATGKLVDKSETLSRWESRLTNKSQLLNQPQKQAAAKLKELSNRNRLLESFFHTDVDRETEDLLESLLPADEVEP